MFYLCNGLIGWSDGCPSGWPPYVSFEVAGPNKFFYQELEALVVIGLVVVVPVIIAS